VIAATVGYADHRLGPQAAIDVPRAHSQGNRTFVDSRAAPDAIAGLRARGHDVVVQEVAPGELPFGRVSAVTVSDGNGSGRRLSAGAGPAWNTAAGGL
jgi:gamma-glutamyltranspeptidase